jgi:hypothetical protein
VNNFTKFNLTFKKASVYCVARAEMVKIRRDSKQIYEKEAYIRVVKQRATIKEDR